MPNYYKEVVSPESPLSDFSRNFNPFTEVKNFLHGSNASLNDGMESQGASSSAPSTVIHDSKTPQKNCASDSSKSQKRKYII